MMFCLLVLSALSLGVVFSAPLGGVNRVFFIAAVEQDWIYAPTGRNVYNPQKQSVADRYIKQGPDRIGGTYTKAIYKQYTDGTFSKEIPTPSWLGLIGPIIRAEVGDNVTVHFRNNGSHDYSIHPHGLFYLKDSESAIYRDGTSGRFKFDDVVMPGSEVTLSWTVHPDDAPAQDDPACIPYVYHSHVNTPMDTNSGLIGVISVCKPGTLNNHGERKDVDHEFFLVAKEFDENANWLTTKNLQKCGNPAQCQILHDSEDEDFIASNKMFSLNGYVFGQLPDLLVCSGDRIAWHVIGMGNEIDLHNIEFQGQLLETQLTVDDNIQVYPAIFKTGMMTASTPGNWVVTCVVTGHQDSGMNAFLIVEDCGWTQPKSSGTTRRYFLAIEEEEWDYGPSGMDNFNGGALGAPSSKSEPFFSNQNCLIGGKYKKLRYNQYSDISFKTKIPSKYSDMGILGPVLRMEAGDDIEITIKNRGKRPFSLETNGLTYNADKGESVSHSAYTNPGGIHVYRRRAPANILGPKDPDCLVKLYFASTTEDVNTGLIGPLVVCRPGSIDKNTGIQRYMKKEFFLLFSTFNENKSWYLDDNIARYSNSSAVNKADDDFINCNLMHGINGRSFANLPVLEMCVGDNVTWHVMSYGSDKNVQAPYFHGNAFNEAGRHRDVINLISEETHSLFMVPDNPGTWAIVSATNRMEDTGVVALYNVKQCGATVPPITDTGATREYNMGIVETDWNYAPEARDLITGTDLNDPRAEFIFVRNDEMFIGPTYKKAIYREYTDNTFKQQKSRDVDNIHLGILGPYIKAEVGDKIKVNLKNMASREYSIHPHGLLYDKANEGKAYKDGLNGGVKPGQTRTYVWHVPERAGPGNDDPNCVPWVYSSAMDSTKDDYSGLVGPIVICRKGILDSKNKRKDVQKEFALLFHIFDENNSWYTAENIATRAPARKGTNYADDEDFNESNLLHSINGLIVGNNKGLEMRINETAAWYLMSTGSELDIHTVHFHGQTFSYVSRNKHRSDVVTVFPGNAEAVEMRAHDVGEWILHCHVLDHISAGMETTYTVLP